MQKSKVYLKGHDSSTSMIWRMNTKLRMLAISELNRKLNTVKHNICAIRLIIEGYNLGDSWLINTEAWLRKITTKENWLSRRRLQVKLKVLKQYKKLKAEKYDEEENQRIFNAKMICQKKVIYNNSGEVITKEEEDI